MSREIASAVRGGAVAVVLGVAVGACAGDEPTGLPAPTRHESARFALLDFTEAPQELIDSMLARLELEYDRVDAFLPEFVNPDSILAQILPGNGIPFVTIGSLELVQFRDDLAFDYFVHQLTHLWTRYTRRPFLEEGIAVYATEVLLPDAETVNPYWRQVPHAWVSLFDATGSLIGLDSVYNAANLDYAYRGSVTDAVTWQVFVEAGSFTRWVFDTHGREAWLQLYQSQNLEGTLADSVAGLHAQWIAAASMAFPDPLECADALAPLTPRREFWCRRAENTDPIP